MADSARSAGLAEEAAGALNPELGALSGTIRQLEKDTNLGQDRLRGLATQLKGANVAGFVKVADAMLAYGAV